MPDDPQATPTVPLKPSAELIAATKPPEEPLKMDDALKKDISDAQGSIWKKVLIWGAGILAIIGAVVGIIFLLKGKGPVTGVKEAVQTAKTESAKADMEEKIKVAEAKGAETAVIEKLKEIKDITDEDKRLEELNNLL